MKCTQCGNSIKVKEAKFCPFCGRTIEAQPELAGYTRAQFFNATGDEEFKEAWEEVRNMSAEQAIAWLREKPPVHYVYRIHSEWNTYDQRYPVRKSFINKDDVGHMSKCGRVYVKRSKLVRQLLKDIGTNAFWTQEECQAAIQAELEKSES